jgi:FAD/FMN-containing dehydrogenase
MDGCYVNYPDVDLKHWQLLYYGEQGYRRLQAVKARWDPLDVFNHQQSIELPGKAQDGAAKSEG